MMLRHSMIALLAICCCTGLNAQPKTYTVGKIAGGTLSITGKGDEPAWKNAILLTDFHAPWEDSLPGNTSFSALHDDRWLYLRYIVKDDSIVVFRKTGDKHEIGASDRVEIFLRKDEKMQPYYGLEMDPDARVLDYSANYYRQMDYNWSWPKEDLLIKTSRTADGYVLEAAISFASLRSLGLLQNNRLQAGLFRAESKGFINGRADLHWISWIRPQSEKPDFHIPSAFGELVLQ